MPAAGAIGHRISVQHQKVRIYDANGLFAESSVSTGMPAIPRRWAYSASFRSGIIPTSPTSIGGALMPYMQRITWSGIAMHAGVLLGYPASHGRIRMPMSFAVKM